MKLYKIEPGNGKSTRFCYPHIPQENPWRNESLTFGEYDTIHELPIIYYVENKYKPIGYMFTHRGLLFSKQIMEAIKQVCANIKIFPAHMYYQGKERIFEEYYTIIFPSYDALNMRKSVIIWSDLIPNHVHSIETMVVSKQKLINVPQEDSIFHLKEYQGIILATEIAKIAIEAVSKDVAFCEVEVAE